MWAAWGQGFGDWENRNGTFNGTDIGRRTATGGGLVGLDVTFTNFGSPTGALVLGVLGAGMRSTTNNADDSSSRVDGPGTGVYAVYVNGGFSTDLTFKADFLTVAPSTLPTSLGLNNYVTAMNVNYKFEYGASWFEPTVGANYTRALWNDTAHQLGFDDGWSVRVQGGVRWGTSFDVGGGVKLEPTMMALAYDDVRVEGGTLAAALTPVAPTDQDKVSACSTLSSTPITATVSPPMSREKCAAARVFSERGFGVASANLSSNCEHSQTRVRATSQESRRDSRSWKLSPFAREYAISRPASPRHGPDRSAKAANKTRYQK